MVEQLLFDFEFEEKEEKTNELQKDVETKTELSEPKEEIEEGITEWDTRQIKILRADRCNLLDHAKGKNLDITERHLLDTALRMIDASIMWHKTHDDYWIKV